MKRALVVAALTATLLAVLAATPALANLSRKDPNDFRYKPDIKRSTTTTFRGTYLGSSTPLIRATLTFFDGIPWKKVYVMQVRLDTRGSKGADYSINWYVGDAVEGGFGCWLQEGGGILPGDIILNETEVRSQGRTRTSVTCTVPRNAMSIRKAVRWNAMVWAGPGSASFAQSFDFAPNRKGWYPHL